MLHKGQVREIGTHWELMKKQGLYYKLYQLQYKQQEPLAAREKPGLRSCPPARY